MDIYLFNNSIKDLCYNIDYIDEDSECITYHIKDHTIKVDKYELDNLIEKALSYEEENKIAIFNDHYYETLVKFTRCSPLINIRDPEKFIKEDTINKISYKISKPSDIYIL